MFLDHLSDGLHGGVDVVPGEVVQDTKGGHGTTPSA